MWQIIKEKACAKSQKNLDSLNYVIDNQDSGGIRMEVVGSATDY